MLEDVSDSLEKMRAGLESKARSLDINTRRKEVADLDEEANQPGLWDDPAAAQTLMQKLSAARALVSPFDSLEKRLGDMAELIELAQMEDDVALGKEIERDFALAQRDYLALEKATLFSGQYDGNNAIFSINAGAGGTEAQDWAQMLVRAYLRWAEAHDFKVEVLEENPGEEAGLKGFQAIFSGVNAYGHLRAEAGTHRLVRMSPFNSAGKRQTSFAGVDVVPEMAEGIKIDINPKDLRIDYFLSGGAGGQNVQKNETAVRITHLPTGIVAACQNERSQGRNRDVAMRVLESRLFERERRAQQEEISRVRGVVNDITFGGQIRSYVFQPYQMVKDHRTGHETSGISEVMDGDFDGFIYAFLEQNAGQN